MRTLEFKQIEAILEQVAKILLLTDKDSYYDSKETLEERQVKLAKDFIDLTKKLEAIKVELGI